jgi:hypothetical protein
MSAEVCKRSENFWLFNDLAVWHIAFSEIYEAAYFIVN